MATQLLVNNTTSRVVNHGDGEFTGGDLPLGHTSYLHNNEVPAHVLLGRRIDTARLYPARDSLSEEKLRLAAKLKAFVIEALAGSALPVVSFVSRQEETVRINNLKTQVLKQAWVGGKLINAAVDEGGITDVKTYLSEIEQSLVYFNGKHLYSHDKDAWKAVASSLSIKRSTAEGLPGTTIDIHGIVLPIEEVIQDAIDDGIWSPFNPTVFTS